MSQRLKHIYQEKVVATISNLFGYENIHEIPRLEKIVVNRGLGRASGNAKMVEMSLLELAVITGQYGIVTRSRSPVAGFKIRENSPVGLIVTLRGERIYAFYDRLVNLAFPRIRDFQGVPFRGFDGDGNYNFGLEEQLIFPEISYEQIDILRGINLSVVTTSKTDNERFTLLKSLGTPFQNQLIPIFIYIMVIDTLSDVLTCIRNALRLKRYGVEIRATKMTKILSEILVQESLILEILESSSHAKKRALQQRLLFLRLKYLGFHRISIITNLQRISSSSLRIYVNHKKIPQILGGLGWAIVSTSMGIITDRRARDYGLGGEIVCSIWLK